MAEAISSSSPDLAAEKLVVACCPGCGAAPDNQIAEEFGLGVQRCRRCTVVFVSPRLPEPQHHYQGTREGILRKYGPVLRGEKGLNRDPNYREELAAIARIQPAGRLLDIGTHCGFFLRLARGMGWQLQGVEPSASAELAREFFGLDVLRGYLEDLALPSDSYDVVTIIDVVEHLEEPGRLLSEVFRVLRPGGIVFIKTPNARYNLFKYLLIRRVLRLQRVEVFDAKEHVVQFTRETLGQLLERAGLEVVHDFVPRPIQDGASWKCALRSCARGLARLEHRATGGRFGPLATDLAVIGRKPGLAGGGA
jgi:2-polyprenyl-3-methyl-5-hydroxy-6-metoxy-1,4-benzoquinol methylase